MACVTTYLGEQEIFKRLLGIKTYTALKLKLYSDDRTPSKSDEVSQYTEISGGGYTEITIDPNDWTIASSSAATTAILAAQIFSFTGTITRITGYYITNTAEDVLIFAERFSDGPYENFAESTLQIDLTLSIPT